MKQMLFLAFLASRLCAQAQTLTLPYNPDENADGLIGVADLQGLLAQYGNEFSAAVVSEDGEDAIVFMGNMAYPLCAQSCKNLPGIWTMPTMEDLGLVWDEVYTTNTVTNTWLKSTNPNVFQGLTNNEVMVKTYEYFYSANTTSSTGHYHLQSDHPTSNFGCYCAAQQMPKVEYTVAANVSFVNFSSECEALTIEGWHPIPGSPTSGFGNYSQAFWRWAQ